MNITFNRRFGFLWAMLGVVILGLFSACSNYHLGRAALPPFSTIAIAPIQSSGLVPQAQSALHDQIARAFIADGTLCVVPMGQSSTILEVTITDLCRSISATNDQDTGLARSYEVTLKAICTLTDSESGCIFLKNAPVCATLDLQVNSQYVDIEYQAIPALSRTLAQRIRDRVLNAW